MFSGRSQASYYLEIKSEDLFKDNSGQLRRQLLSIRGLFFVIALMKCDVVAFREQNKIIVYVTHKKMRNLIMTTSVNRYINHYF